MSELEVYHSTSKCQRPDDGLIESECARFKSSGADFGIVELTSIKRWLTISPVLQFEIHKTEKEANAECMSVLLTLYKRLIVLIYLAEKKWNDMGLQVFAASLLKTQRHQS